MIHLQSNDKQQVDTHGKPYLCGDCTLGRPIERLDVQVLLEPVEKQLHLPPISVEEGDVLGHQSASGLTSYSYDRLGNVVRKATARKHKNDKYEDKTSEVKYRSY